MISKLSRSTLASVLQYRGMLLKEEQRP